MNKALKSSRFGDSLYFRRERTLKRTKKERTEPDKIYISSEDFSYPQPAGKIHLPATPYPDKIRLVCRAGRIPISSGEPLQHKEQKAAKKAINFSPTVNQTKLLQIFNREQGSEPYKIWIRRHQRARFQLVRGGYPLELLKQHKSSVC